MQVRLREDVVGRRSADVEVVEFRPAKFGGFAAAFREFEYRPMWESWRSGGVSECC